MTPFGRIQAFEPRLRVLNWHEKQSVGRAATQGQIAFRRFVQKRSLLGGEAIPIASRSVWFVVRP